MSDVSNPDPNPPPPSPAAPAPAAPAAPSPTATKPEGLPDHFWDPATGLRAGELVTSYNELAGEAAKRAETFKDFPAKAEEAGNFYKLPENMLPEGVTLPDGVEIKPNTDLLGKALPILHKHQADPALFQDLARAFTGYELERFQSASKQFAEDNKKLGANAEARRNDLASRITAAVGAERAKFIDTRIISADAVTFFEALFKDGNIAPLNSHRDTDPPPPPTTVEQRWYGGAQQKAS